jgi:hypothetical protein
MKTNQCTICKNPFLRATIDRLLDEKMTYTGIERYAGDAGVVISADVVSRHSKHYAPPPTRAPGANKRDFAIVIRDKAMELIENDGLDLRDKDTVPGINAGLKAQSILDGREKQKSKQQSAELAFAIIQMLGGGGPPPIALQDGMTIEGSFEEVEETDG